MDLSFLELPLFTFALLSGLALIIWASGKMK